MSEWWVGRQGANPVGPVSMDTLVRGIVEKKVPEDALVCRVGAQEWRHIPEVEEIWELVHPEQEEHTNVTKRPWFADKPQEAPPELPELDSDDESTRILSMPIMPMRTIDVESHQKPAERAKLPAEALGKNVVVPRPQVPSGTTAAVAAQKPAPAAGAHAPKTGLRSAPGFSAPGATHPVSTAATSGGAAAPAAPTTSVAQAPGQGSRGSISPPRFGTERVSVRPAAAAPAATASPKEPIGSKVPLGLKVAQPNASPALNASGQGHTAPKPQGAEPELEPDSSERPSVPLVAVRPSPIAAPQPAARAVPLQASRPSMPTPPQVRPLTPSENKPAAPPSAEDAPIIVGHPRGPVDYDDDTVTVIAKSPIGAQPSAADLVPLRPQTSTRAVPPPEPTPLMPTAIQNRPAAAPKPARVTVREPTAPPAAVRFSATTTQPSAVAMPQAALPASSAPSIPPPPEVEPSDLFDEDFEAPPPAPPVGTKASDDLSQGSLRPAAGTPAGPSVIVTHRPPSMHDELLSQAIPHIAEETRPALRSLRAPGTVQVSIGALIIGALIIIVVMLFVVLLLRGRN
jgi:hypothetical protein